MDAKERQERHELVREFIQRTVLGEWPDSETMLAAVTQADGIAWTEQERASALAEYDVMVKQAAEIIRSVCYHKGVRLLLENVLRCALEFQLGLCEPESAEFQQSIADSFRTLSRPGSRPPRLRRITA